MASIPVYTTFTAGTVVTATQLNTQIVTAGNFWLARPYCNIFSNAGVTAPTSGAYVLASWDSESDDNDGMHSTISNNSRIVINTLGVFTHNLCVGWPNATTGARGAMLRLNSAGSNSGGAALAYAFEGPNATSGQGVTRMTHVQRHVNIGDYVEYFFLQVSGASQTTNTGSAQVYASALWEIA